MSEQIVGTVAGIKPRGQAKGFWTAEINVGKQYPVKVSFHQFKKDSEEPTGYYELLQQAMAERKPVVAEFYETEGEYNGKPVTYRNGSHFEIANGQVAAQAQGTTDGGSRGSSKDEYWERRETEDQRREHEIEAAWALGTLLQFEEYRKDPELLAKKVHQLIRLKHQIARELAG